ncbi:MAG: tetratricopeptide repeat protein, partial [Anaerolineae bacterium]|nr:tetratricopeptide repeat protein [Anaerolineae bacterium]
GDFLEGLSLDDCADFELWLVAERERWRQRTERALNALIVHHAEAQACEEALRFARRLLALAPWREETHRQVMRLLADQGQRGAALAQYEACCRALEAELGVGPSAETVALYEQICDEKVVPQAMTTSVVHPSPRHNLPAQATPFIGRETQLTEVRELLVDPDVRLLTLTGVGGTGKTRLALQVAAGLLDVFSDGVFFVPLAPIRDPALVIPAIAATLGVRESGDILLIEALQYALRDKQRLLLVDNFEHVLNAVSSVSQLLTAAPQLKVLVTSRAPLHIYGEHEYVVPPMAVPHPQSLPSLDRLNRTEAVSLFVQGARQVQPDFTLGEANAPAVVEICARLDGLPLAIELAAARIKLFSPQAMLARLKSHPGGRLHFLTDGPRDMPARQRTLRATIAWSYNLLNAKERTLFRCLSVFAGGCTWEAAAAVCVNPSAGVDGYPNPDDLVLDRLQSLVDQNLLQTSKAGDQVRFTMLETIREYAQEKANGVELIQARDHHLDYYLDLVKQAQAELRGARRALWQRWSETEHDNLRAALSWSLDNREQAVLQLSGTLWRFWKARGYISEGRHWLEAILARNAAAPPALKSEALAGLGLLALVQGDLACAQRTFAEDLELQQALGCPIGIVKAMGRMAYLSRLQGNQSDAAVLLQDSLDIARTTGDKSVIAGVLTDLGNVAWRQGQYERAVSLLEESLMLYEQVGDTFNYAQALGLMGSVAREQGQFALAQTRIEKSCEMLKAIGDKQMIVWALSNLGRLAYCEGNHALACTYLQDSLALARDLGDKYYIANVLAHLGDAVQRLDDDMTARALYAECLRLSYIDGNKLVQAQALEGCASLALRNGQSESAARMLSVAQAIRDRIGSPVTPVLRVWHEQDVAVARAALGEPAFASTWAEGQAMTLEQATAYALEQMD